MEFYLKGREIKMRRSGFSLVEILIVAGVLSVLAVVFTA
jgi:prepilin-type N-terminal cleavage/methylation domain-containing protein